MADIPLQEGKAPWRPDSRLPKADTHVPAAPEHQAEELPMGTTPQGQSGQEANQAASISAQIKQSGGQSAGAVGQDPLLTDIENILEEDLDEVYSQLPADKREMFKEEGEATAVEIRGVVARVKFRTSKIFHLIKKWMKLIPGVNRFFLEQEAKIKTDEIVDLTEGKDGQPK